MTNPIELLEQKLDEITHAEKLIHKHNNYKDLKEVKRQKQMYISSIHILKESLKLK